MPKTKYSIVPSANQLDTSNSARSESIWKLLMRVLFLYPRSSVEFERTGKPSVSALDAAIFKNPTSSNL